MRIWLKKGIIILIIIILATTILTYIYTKRTTLNNANKINYLGNQYIQNKPYAAKKLGQPLGKCFIDIYVSKNFIEESNTYIQDYCKKKCYENNATLYESRNILANTNKNNTYNITAYKCVCNICLNSKDGEANFEFINKGFDGTKCRDSDKIEVSVKNIGKKDIKNEDWVIHTIDGNEIELWPRTIRIQETETIIEDVNSLTYKPGEHIIKLKLKNSKAKNYTVICK